MIVIRHNLDTLDRSMPPWLEARRRAATRSPSATSRCASTDRRARARAAHRRALLEVIHPPSAEDMLMLVIQRPTVEAARRGRRQPPAVRHRPARARLRLHHRQLAAPHAAVVDPRRGRHQVRFDDALHEFDTIAGVTEDVTDIILNLKDVVLHVDVRRARHRAPRRARARPTVTAGDIKAPAEVEILNPRPPHRHAERQGPPGHRPHRRAGPGLHVGRAHQRRRRPSASSRSTRSSRRCGGSPSTSSRPGSSSRPTTTASCSTSRPTARSRPARPWPRPAPRCASLVDLVADDERRAPGPRAGRGRRHQRPGRPTSTSPSRTSTSPSVPATASSGPRSTPSASWSLRPRTTCSPSPTSARSRSTR